MRRLRERRRVSTADLALAARLARRDLRGAGRRHLWAVIACLALGVAAVQVVAGLSRAVEEAVARDARTLFGGDLLFESGNQRPERKALLALLPPGSELAQTLRTTSIAHGAEGRRVTVSLKAVDDAYPLYGELDLDPAMPIGAALDERGVAVDPTVLPRLGLEIGDSLRIGEADYEIRAVVRAEPDAEGGFARLGPRVFMHLDDLAAAGITSQGALLRQRTLARVPAGDDPLALVGQLNRENPDAAWRARSFRELDRRIARTTDRLGTYLTLAALSILLVAGVGLGLAARSHLDARAGTIATLKSLGAGSGLVLRVYALQLLGLALVGGLMGVILGFGLGALIGRLTADFSPIRIAVDPALLAAACAGVLLAVLAVASAPRPGIALALTAGVAVASVLLVLLARLAVRGLSRLGRQAPAAYRLAFANLGRAGGSAPSVAAVLGAGLGALVTLGLVEYNLERELADRLPARAPSHFVIDIPPNSMAAFEAAVATAPGAEILERAPLLRARVTRIADVPIDQVEVDPEVAWTLRRDRGLTFADTMPPRTELTAGSWWPADYRGPPLVSVDDEVARGYRVGIGDTLTFNILGRSVTAEIASTREVEWEDAGLGFVFVFSPGLLDAAPHTYVATLEVPRDAEAGLLDALATAAPNATPISVRDVLDALGQILERIGLAIAAVGAFALVAGLTVLAAAVDAARRRHLYDTVVLRLLGARRARIVRLVLAEYLGLGGAAALTGIVAGTLAAAALVHWGLDLPWRFGWWPVLQTAAAGLVAVTVVAWLGTRAIINRTPARALREI
jgi:putative ABC transport system permease protein